MHILYEFEYKRLIEILDGDTLSDQGKVIYILEELQSALNEYSGDLNPNLDKIIDNLKKELGEV